MSGIVVDSRPTLAPPTLPQRPPDAFSSSPVGKRSTPPGLQCDYAGEENAPLRRAAPLPLTSDPRDAGDADSATTTPPAYRKWAHSLTDLLGDRQGVAMFKSFLDAELGGVAASNSLDFWFACNGLKLVKDKKRIHQLSRVIYKKYIKSNHLGLSYESRHRITEKLKSADVNQNLFDAVQDDVEDNMRINMYPMFLKSDTYIAYLQAGGSESPLKSSSNSTESVTATALPTLHEGQELKQEDLSDSLRLSPSTTLPLSSSAASADVQAAVVSMLSLTPQSLMVTSGARHSLTSSTSGQHSRPFTDGVYPAEMMLDTGGQSGCKTTAHKRKLNPYHVTYAATSTRDSELQSMSSDAQTTDDSSIDGRGPDHRYHLTAGHHQHHHAGPANKHWRKHHRSSSVRHNASQNRRTGLNEPIIARTDCVPKDRNLAETSPSAFADMLIDRLLKVKLDDEQTSRVHQRMRHIAEHDPGYKKPVSLIANALGAVAHASQQRTAAQQRVPPTSCAPCPAPSSTTANATASSVSDHSAQSILEEHVSRIWDSSSADSPVRTPRLDANSVGPPATQMQHTPRPSPMDRRTTLPGDRGRYNRPIASMATTRRLTKDNAASSLQSNSVAPIAKQPCDERIMAWISGNTRVSSDNKTQYSTDQSDTRSSSIHQQRSLNNRSYDQQFLVGGQQQQQQHQQLNAYNRSYANSQAYASEDHAKHHQHHHQHQHQQNQALSKSMLSYEQDARLKMPPPSAPHFSQSFTGPSSRSQSYPLDLSSGEESFIKHPTTVHKNTPIKPRPRAQENTITVVGYYFCGEPIPYRSTISTPITNPGITLAHFKQLITKRGHYRYFFKKACDEFDSGVVHEEITNDLELLPLWDGKVVAKVERVESPTTTVR